MREQIKDPTLRAISDVIHERERVGRELADAISGLLAFLPELWGDRVVGGRVDLTCDAESVSRATAALSEWKKANRGASAPPVCSVKEEK